MTRTGPMIAGMNGPHRLAIYGSLAPGRPNHHQVTGLRGLWFPGGEVEAYVYVLNATDES